MHGTPTSLTDRRTDGRLAVAIPRSAFNASRGKNNVGTSYYIQLLRVSLYKSLTAANNINSLVDERHTMQWLVYGSIDNTTYQQKFSHLRLTKAEHERSRWHSATRLTSRLKFKMSKLTTVNSTLHKNPVRRACKTARCAIYQFPTVVSTRLTRPLHGIPAKIGLFIGFFCFCHHRLL